MGIIELEEMQFYSYIGCLESEKVMPNLCFVDFKAEVDMQKAGESDNLEDCLDYSKIYDLIKIEMSKPANLLEHVTSRIFKKIESNFPQIEHFTIRVSKKNPPVAGKVAFSRVTLTK